MPAIEVSHLTKEYRLGALQGLKQALLNTGARLVRKPVQAPPLFKALDDVSFTIEQGEVVGIIGHNGAGKSTLLKTLARVTTPTSGTVRVNGRIAPLIEVGAGFVPDFTGRENVYLNGAILGMSRKEIDRKFDEIVDFAEMAEFIDTPVKRYSSGMQVKLAFAVATSIDSEILIVDEVLAVGDLAFQQKCIERMESLIKHEGRTVTIVGHNIRQLQRICSRVILLNHGKIAMDDKPNPACARFYEESQTRNISRHITDKSVIRPQRTTGDIEIHRVGIIDNEGKKIDSAVLHNPLTIEIELSSTRVIEKPEITLGIHTSDFVTVIGVNNQNSASIPSIHVGMQRIECTLDHIPLRPGPYSLRIVVFDQYRQRLWDAENIIPIVVQPGGTDITKLPDIGIIDIPSKWSRKPI